MVHGVGVLDWTANSPDLNHIENLWGIVKRQINHVIRLLPENSAVLKSWRIPDSLTPSLSACEEKSKRRRVVCLTLELTVTLRQIQVRSGFIQMNNTMKNPSAHPSYSHYYLLSPSTLFLFLYSLLFFCTSCCFLHISLSFAHLIVFCTSYCFALFYFIAHFTLISPFLTICMPLCYVTYTICILIVLHCPLSGPDSIAFHF